MLIFNGIKFAEKESEFIDSLFEEGGTCYGYAKRLKRSIRLYDHQHNIFGVINQERVLGSARQLENGKVWYSYGTPEIFKSLSCSEKDNMINTLAVNSDHIGLIFK